MNILYITDPTIVGGATKCLIELVDGIRNKGNTVVVCNGEKSRLNDLLEEKGVQTIPCGHQTAMTEESKPNTIKHRMYKKYEGIRRICVNLPRAMKRIEQQIDMGKIDIIHTNSSRSDIGCLLAKKYGIPHIMHIREFGIDDFNCYYRRSNYISFLNKNVDYFIAVSDAVMNSWKKRGINADKIKRIYDGIDIGLFCTNRELDCENTELKMVLVGGICEAKGQFLCVEALSHMPPHVLKELRVDFIGWDDPNYKSKIVHFVHEKKLDDYVRFLGPRDDIHILLQNYDIGLMCSRSEGFGRVTIEYMLSGLGVIASDSGANRELVKHENTGLLFANGNAVDLARKMETFFDDRKLLTKCRKNGQINACESFSLGKNIENIWEVYNHVVKKCDKNN